MSSEGRSRQLSENVRYQSRSSDYTNLSPVLTEYCEAQEKEVALRGKNTIVMMQIGSFLEIYEIRLYNETNPDEDIRIGNAHIMRGALNQMKEAEIPSSGKDTKWYKGKRVKRILKYGFTLMEESKKTFINVANKMGYIVPVYYQIGGRDPVRGMERRECMEVWSPLVRPGDTQGGSRWFGTIITSLYDDFKTSKIGLINPVTRVYSSYTTHRDGMISIESHNVFSTHKPSEIIIWVRCEDGDELDEDFIRRIFGVPQTCPTRLIRISRHKELVDKRIKECASHYVKDREVSFGDGSLPDEIVIGLDYLHNVLPMSLEGSHMLHEENESNIIRLENQPLRQLYILPGEQSASHTEKRTSCVRNLMDKTLTKMGERTHVRWITNPLTDIDIISKRQALGKWFYDGSSSSRLDAWGDILRVMLDMGSLFSPRFLGGMKYELIWNCCLSFESFLRVAEETEIPIIFPRKDAIAFVECIQRDIVPPEKMSQGGNAIGGTIDYSYGGILSTYPDVPFTEIGGGEEIHRLSRDLRMCISKMELFVESLMEGGSISRGRRLPKGSVRFVYMPGAYRIVTSGSAVSRITKEKTFKGITWRNLSVVGVEGSGRGPTKMIDGNTFIKFGTSDEEVKLSTFLTEMARFRKQLDDSITEKWFSWSMKLRSDYESTVREMATIIGNVDATRSAAMTSYTLGYVWPTLHEVSEDESSWFRVEDLRHPLIEELRHDVRYVPHTIGIGKYDDMPTGRLVYGVNSSGKSSLMKAVGVAVILAQSGFPVPAKTIEIGMFKSLYTRIVGNDDLFRGLSTFKVESGELIRILRTADNHSLVLGDELCSGTEQYGAEAIVAASILTLLRRRCAFLFATHWHRLRDIPDLINNPNLAWNHLLVDVDNSGNMRMDRRIMDGAGPRGYAITFMEKMGADEVTMLEARRIRDMITSESFAVLSSRAWTNTKHLEKDGIDTEWNKKALIQTRCQICNERPTEETDHIIPRKLANEKGAILGGGNVHNGGNLVGLCGVCHARKTRGEIIIHGYEEVFKTGETTSSRVLQWENVENERTTTTHSHDTSGESDTSDVDFVNETIYKMAKVGKKPKQIQIFLKRFGHTIRIRDIQDKIKKGIIHQESE